MKTAEDRALDAEKDLGVIYVQQKDKEAYFKRHFGGDRCTPSMLADARYFLKAVDEGDEKTAGGVDDLKRLGRKPREAY